MANVDQQVINAQLNAKIDIQNTKIDAFIDEMRDFKNEMRDRDNQRHSEIVEIRNLIDDSNKYVRNLTFTAIGAIAAMVITVLLK